MCSRLKTRIHDGLPNPQLQPNIAICLRKNNVGNDFVGHGTKKLRIKTVFFKKKNRNRYHSNGGLAFSNVMDPGNIQEHQGSVGERVVHLSNYFLVGGFGSGHLLTQNWAEWRTIVFPPLGLLAFVVFWFLCFFVFDGFLDLVTCVVCVVCVVF